MEESDNSDELPQIGGRTEPPVEIMGSRDFDAGGQVSDTDVNIEETKASRVISENNRRHYEDFMESQSEVNSNDNNSDFIK